MEYNPIIVMNHEHTVIQKAKPIIEELKDYWKEDAEKFTAVVGQLITFFREYSDGYHHRKEEDVLFPAIYNHPEFILHEVIDEFQDHHESFRGYVTEIEGALAAHNYKYAYKELFNYLQDLLDHIGAENDELFVVAENLLSEEELETIYFKFKDIDLELGEDRKRELEESIDEIVFFN